MKHIQLIGSTAYSQRRVGTVSVVESVTSYTLPLDQLSEAYAKAVEEKNEKAMAKIRRQYKTLAAAINEIYNVNLLTPKK